jgi:hypothetical protein
MRLKGEDKLSKLTESLTSIKKPSAYDAIAQIFKEMKMAYGQRFVDKWGFLNPEEMADYWIRKMRGCTMREIRNGLDNLPQHPPEPHEFFKICRPPPDVARSYREAIDGLTSRGRGERGYWSHPAIFWAASPMRHEILSLTYPQVKEQWQAALEIQMSKGEWEEIPKPPLQIEMARSKDSKKHYEKLLNDIGAGQIFKPKEDEKAWARKMLENPNATPTMMQMAKDALSVKDDL